MQNLRKLLIAKCNQDEKEIERLMGVITAGQKPHNFNPFEPDNVLMVAENSFEEICSTMEENGVSNPKRMTEFEFYSKLRYYEKKFKKK